MSTPEELGAALDKLIPKDLASVITLNEGHADLRIATPADLEPLRSSVPYYVFAQDIADWTLIALDWHPKGPPGQILVALFGYNIDRHCGWHTSQIVGYDEATGCVLTKSGSTYRMVGERSDKPDLLRVCSWVHTAKIGEHLGVFHVYY